MIGRGRLKSLELDLRRCCEAVFEAGFFVNEGGSVGADEHDRSRRGCCLLGSVLFARGEEVQVGLGAECTPLYWTQAARLLGLEGDEVMRLELGFMRPERVWENPGDKLMVIGASLRRDYAGDPEVR